MKSMVLLCLLSGSAVGAESELIGGREVSRAEFPEMVRIRQGNATCSATIVGPRAILTAAHCSTADGEIVPVSESQDVIFDHAAMPANNFRARCTLAPKYRAEDHDVALCYSESVLPAPYAEIVNAQPQVGEVVTLAGFGCTRSDGSGGNNGRLKAGEVAVSAVAAGRPHAYWFVTRGQSALCFGDSGGPAFKRVGKGVHQIYGVNSRGNIRDTSYLTALGLPISQEFFRSWAQERRTQICGVTSICR